MRTCLTAEEALRFLGEGLGPEADAEVHTHLAECAHCSALIAAASRDSASTATSLAAGQGEIGLRIGRYRVEGLIGAGGNGAVYRCLDPSLGRTVALKVQRAELQGPPATPELAKRRRTQLLDEAKLMARLVHPNVVSVYDVDTVEDQVFVVMELVEGGTLRHWLHQSQRSWREIVSLFVKAGQGLAAAHAAGLVHRDFKPENVLIGQGGEVKVTDFGLARAVGGGLQEPPADGSPASTQPTSTSSIAGTPGYVPPEQLTGSPPDARGDQFSFCVALYEALYGERPHRDPLGPRSEARVAAPPKDSLVPGWLRKTVLRGIATDPEQRYATLQDLLDAMVDDPAARRKRRWLYSGLAAAVTAAAIGGTLLWRHQLAITDPCRDPDQHLAGIWDDEVRVRVRAAFAATGATNAAVAATYAEKAMDRVALSWLTAYQEACRATRVLHAQPEAALDLRLDCMNDQLLDVQATSAFLLSPEAHDVASAMGAASALPAPSECSDAHALPILAQPSAASRPQVEALRRKLAQGEVFYRAGRHRKALEVLEPLPKEAELLEAPALEARCLYRLATVYGDGDPDDQRRALELYARAESLADRDHLERFAIQVAALAIGLKVRLGAPLPDLDRELAQVQQRLRRLGGGAAAESVIEDDLAAIAAIRGQDTEVLAHLRRALQLTDQLWGSESDQSLVETNNLAAALEPFGKYDEMVQLLRRAIATCDSLLGPRNERAILPQLNLASMLVDLGRNDEAVQALARLFPRFGASDQVLQAGALAAQGVVEARRGQRAESLRTVAHAMELATRFGRSGSPDFASIYQYVTEAQLWDGQPKQACESYERYLAQQSLPPNSPTWVAFLRLGGWAYLDAGQPKRALPLLERALALSAAHPFYPGWVARLRVQLARALVATGGDRQRAEALAQAAHDELVDVDVAKDLLAEVDAWRAEALQSGQRQREPAGSDDRLAPQERRGDRTAHAD